MEKKYKILVVDDEFGMREGIRRILAPYEHTVITAEDGREAKELIKKESFDLAFLDMKLPDTSGLEILEEIKTSQPLTVCIIITAYATLDTAVSATKKGAFDYLAKPFTTDQLLTVADKALDRRDLLMETDRLRKERDSSLLELTHEKTRFRTIISSMQDGVIVTNKENQVVLFNGKGKSFIKSPGSFIPGIEINNAINNNEIVKMVYQVADPETDIWVAAREIEADDKTWLANCSVIRDSDDNFMGTVILFRDISPIKEVEKLKARFVSTVVHELRAPVAAIKGYLEIIQGKAAGEDPETYNHMLKRSSIRADGLLQLIEDLLNMNRLDSRKVERHIKPVDLKKVLTENIEFFTPQLKEKNIVLETSFDDAESIVKCDIDELNRIITNLLSNAIKYNKTNGKIEVGIIKEGKDYTFWIADTGIGISEQDQERLFKDFFRANNPQARRETGTGLGLSITKRMVEANFGTIEVESIMNEGTRFSVNLPAA
ncbi:MAG: response regulator [Vulcanimicrobiota bacterium]